MTVYDWAASYTEAQRIEHSFSVAARQQRAVSYFSEMIFPALTRAMSELSAGVDCGDAEMLLVGLRRLADVGELARFEAEKLEGRA